jgi:TrmH family RNA methyltransferase
VVAAVRIFDEFDAAVSGCVRVAATTARRRSSQQAWSEPGEAARSLLDRTATGDIALVFGREDRGLPNDVLDRCDDAICIPTTEHSSLNLGHAAAIILYEIRQAARASVGLAERDLSGKLRDQAEPATAGELEAFFEVWERAMKEIGMFRGVPPAMKMRSYRRILRRADMDRRELRLFKATAYRIARHARRAEARIRAEFLGKERESPEADTERSGGS